jgi:hypothetical protein
VEPNEACALFCKQAGLLATCFMLHSCLAYSLTLKMEATCSSKTMVGFQWTTQSYIPEDRTFQEALCDKYGLNHMGNRMKSFTTVVNFTGSCALNTRHFKLVLKEANSLYGSLLMYNHVHLLDSGMYLTDLSSV